jgi:hypothetical protein
MMNGWEDFITSELTSSAVLTGLIFVGVSVNLKMITSRAILSNLALQALVALVVVLFISSLLLVPGQPFLAIGIEVLLIGLIDWVMVSLFQLKRMRTPQYQYRLQFIPYIVLSQSATLCFVIAGVVFLISGVGALYWIVAATLLSFLDAFLGAWVLLIEINR